MVALSDAWQKGAQSWDEQQLRNFANDPANLQATDGTTNQRKGAGDAATWLPPNRGYWCTYVARQTQVKATYRLWMTAAEKQRIGEILTDCRDDPAEATAPESRPAAPSAPASSPKVAEDRPLATTTAVPTTLGEVPEYANCTDVWARHGGPILRTDPGYRSKFDGDDDGIGCENPPR